MTFRGGRLNRVADRVAGVGRPLAGRAGELDAVAGVVHKAARGDGGALLVSGEAGVGKTALIREAVTKVGEFTQVLWGSCLPMTSLAVPFLPLSSALRGWAAEHEVPVPVPVLGGSAEASPVSFDGWLDQLSRQRPVLLVVDDLQWADGSSLDVLMYVLAGLAGRRLAVVTTQRTGEESDSLHRWLADVRRLPSVDELRLGRLDRVATAEQLAGLVGRAPHQSLVDDVFARSKGNPYLTTLLTRGVSPEARSLPTGLPTELKAAATRAWRRLSAPARAVTELVAVAGRPQPADQLGKIAAATGVGGDILPLLREAVAAAVLEVSAGGNYWFVHPLLAEVLETELLPEERQRLHAAFAAASESAADPHEMTVQQIVDLADHHYGARHPQDAYRCALLGADAAGQAGGTTEMLRLLRRALGLLPHVPDAGMSKIDLLRRIQIAADQAGEQEEELAAVDELLAIVDRDAQPLLAAELLVRQDDLRAFTGQRSDTVAAAREAVRLSARYPKSPEYALAMAQLACGELWDGQPAGAARARKAVHLARHSGSDKALAWALVAKATAQFFACESGGLAEAGEAQQAAARAKDYMGFIQAVDWEANCLDTSAANRDVIECMRRGRAAMISLGAPHCYVASCCAYEAFGLLLLGEWRACVGRLRVALGSTPGPRADLIARLTAALLAVWQGRLSEAQAHLSRAEEISSDRYSLEFYGYHAVHAELALTSGDTERATQAVRAGLEVPHSNLAERLIPLAGRALADTAQAFLDRGQDPAPALEQLNELRSSNPTVTASGPGPMHDLQLRAMQAWYDAEIYRGRQDPVAETAWQQAAQACVEAQLQWDEAYCWWRAAEALTKDRTTRDAATVALRRAHELAVDLQAAPLLANVQALAQSARISLDVIDQGRQPQTGALTGLTPREREILDYIVTGRTYREIARELVISEKTVGVHVSHLLQKTGTTNRVELAQLARRIQA